MTAAEFQAWANQGLVNGSSLARSALQGFNVLYQDADGDLDELETWRAMAWTLLRENPAAISGVDRWVTNAIGTGLRLQADFNRPVLADLTGLSDDAFDELEMVVEDDFQEWADNKYHCDAHGQQDWYGQQSLALKSKQVAGDGIAILSGVQRRHSPYVLRSQIVDPARMSNENEGPDTHRIAGGVERDGNGMVVRHHFREVHPDTMKVDDNSKFTWRKIPAYGARTGRPNVLHVFDAIQPGASRGVPLLKPIVKIIKQLGRFSDATVMASVVHAFFSIAFENASPSDFNYGNNDESIKNENGQFELREGTGMFLPPGVKPHMLAPSQPGPNLDQFFANMLRHVGMALGIPHEVLVMEFRSSYSAARAALNEFWKGVLTARRSMVSNFCKPTYVAFLMDRVIRGHYEMPGFMADPRIQAAWCRSQWLGPARGMIDKPKEILPELELYRHNGRPISSISEELTQVPYSSTLRRIVRDKRLFLKHELQDAQNAPKLLDSIEVQQELMLSPPDEPPEQPGNENET